MEVEPERYAGRPLLIVLENYTLDCIGELPPDKQALANQHDQPLHPIQFAKMVVAKNFAPLIE